MKSKTNPARPKSALSSPKHLGRRHAARPKLASAVRRVGMFEQLEGRRLLTTYYVNDTWVELVNSAPLGTPGVVEPGDIVGTAPGDSPAVSGIVFDVQAHATIQNAVDKFFVTGLDTIQVISGTYPQNVSINDTLGAHAAPLDGLKVLGPQSGVDARTRSGQPEAVVTAASANETGPVFYVDATANNITIDGFTFDGNGAASGGVTLLDGATDSNAARGVVVDGDNVVVANNLVRNFYRRGVQYGFNDAPTGGTVIRNDFNLIGANDTAGGANSGFAVLAFASPNVIDNDVTNAHNGTTHIQVYPPSSSAITISGNNIAARESGITLNETSSAVPAITVTNNTVTTTAAGGVGAVLWSVGGGLNFSNNAFTTTAADTTGIHAWVGTAGVPMNVTVSDGTISGYARGLHMTNEADVNGTPTPANDAATVSLDDVTITPAAGGIGVFVEDTAAGTTNVTAGLNNVTINGSASGTGVRLSGAQARLAGHTLGDTSFAGFSGTSQFVALANGAYGPSGEINGTGATYNGVAGGAAVTDPQGYAIEDRMTHRIDVPGVGLVRVRPGHVYVTPNSFSAPTTTAPSIQRGIDAANSGEAVNIQGGTYADSVTINKAVTLDGQGSGPTPLVNWTANGSNPLVRITSTNATDDVTIADVAFDGLNLAGDGVRADAPANFDRVTVNRSSFTNIRFDAVSINGDATNGVSARDVVLSNLSFTNNGTDGGGGAGDVSLFQYNGDASLTNLTLVGSGTATTGARLGIQMRGVGAGTGAGLLPMGTVAFDNVDVSGSYRTQMIGIQRYGNVNNLSFNNVKLGGATSAIAGTFGALMRFDAVGTGTPAAPAAVNLGNTHFRGVSNTSAQPTYLEFAPDNAFAFLRADATNTIWNLPSGTNLPAASLTVAQAYDAEDRILDYVKNLPSNGSFKGWAELQNGKAFVTPTVAGPINGSSITRAAEVVDNAGTIHIKSGAYAGDVNTSAKSVRLSPGSSPGQVTINGNLTLDGNDALDIELVGTNPATQFDNFIVNGTVTLGGATLNLMPALTSGGSFTIVANDGTDPVNGQFAQGSSVTVGTLTFAIDYAGGDGNDVVLSLGAPGVVWVNDNWVITNDTGPAGLSFGDEVANTGAGDDGTVTNKTFGVDAFDTVQGGVSNVAAPGTVNVLAGTYDEDVAINVDGTKVLGAGAGTKTVRGAIGGDGATFRIAASNVELAGLTITRLGNNPTDWNNPGLNSAGVAIQGQAITNALIRDNVIVGNRTGIDVNNSNGHTIRNNQINDNRTGLIFRNQTDNLLVTENEIADNWTVGVLFLDASGGTNVPVQQALNSTFTNNDIGGNWYGQIVDRQVGGSLPAPGTTNLKNFSGNWFGTASPVISTANSAEPGYAGQIPVAYGGTATAPGGQPDVLGPGVANFDITPMLVSGTDTNVETTPGRGTFGFQGDFSAVKVTDELAQTGSTGRIQEGVNTVPDGGTVHLEAGTYAENVTIPKAVTIDGEGSGPAPLVTWTTTNSNPLATITASNATDDVTFLDIAFDGTNGANTAGDGIRAFAPAANFDALTVDRSTFTDFSFNGISVSGNATTGIAPRNVVISNSSFTNNGTSGGGGAGDVSLFQYNGDASFNNLTLTGNATATTGARLGIQMRGVGSNAATVLPMGTVSFNGVDVSGKYRTQMIGLQRYADVNNLSFNNVKLGGATSEITGTFGASLRLDAVGVGTLAAPATINLGNTMFRGLAATSAQRHEIEIAPDNNYTFLRANGANTQWRIGGIDVPAGALTLAQAFQVEDRILHYVDKLNPTHGTYKGFVDIQPSFAFVTDEPEAGALGEGSIQRGSEVVPVGGTVHVEAGTYNQLATINKTVNLLGAQAGVDARTRVGQPESILANAGGSLSVNANNVVIDGFTVTGASAAPLGTGVFLNSANSGYQVLNNIFTNNTIGLYLNSQGGTQTVVRHNLFDSNNQPGSGSGNGIYTDQGSKNVLVEENRFTGHTSAAMVFAGAPGTQQDITVNNNQMVNDNSIAFFNTTNVDITNNTSTGSLGSVIFLGGGNNDVTISGNTASGAPTRTGVSLPNPSTFGMTANSNVTIANNSFTGLLNGIRAGTGSTSDAIAIQGNTLSGNTNGIRLDGGSADVTADNDIANNTGAGVLVETGGAALIDGNSPGVHDNFVGIDVAGGTATISNNTIADNTTGIRVRDNGTATITSNQFSFNGIGLLVDAGNATITDTQRIDGVGIGNGGTVTLSEGNGVVLVTTSLNVTGSGRLDLRDNAAIIDYTGASPVGSVFADLQSGYAAGAWTGPGIMSTTAANDPNDRTAVGYAEATDLFGSFPATFEGQTIDATSVLLKYTLYGDADLNGNVNLTDFNRLAANFGQSPRRWSQGDFTFDQLVNLEDFNRLAGNFGMTVADGAVTGPSGDEKLPSLEELARPAPAARRPASTVSEGRKSGLRVG